MAVPKPPKFQLPMARAGGGRLRTLGEMEKLQMNIRARFKNYRQGFSPNNPKEMTGPRLPDVLFGQTPRLPAESRRS